MMTKLAEQLKVEMEEWGQKSYAQLVAIEYPHVYSVEKRGAPDVYKVEATLLEDNDEYIHVSVAVSRGGLSAFFPKASSVIVYRNVTAEEIMARLEADPLIKLERAWQKALRDGQPIAYECEELRGAWASTHYPNAMLFTLALLDQRAALGAALRVVAETCPDFFGDIASLDLSGPLPELIERLGEATWPGFFGMRLAIGDQMADAIRAAVPAPCAR